MRWIRHSRLEGQHAFLGASKHSWINYDEDKLTESYFSYLASKRGTELHELALKAETSLKEQAEMSGGVETETAFVRDNHTAIIELLRSATAELKEYIGT